MYEQTNYATNMESFNQIFKSQKANKIGNKLKEIIESHFDNISGSIVGGEKVKLVLYSRNGKNNVLCGIQEGTIGSCMLYVHHIDELNHGRLKFLVEKANTPNVSRLIALRILWKKILNGYCPN